MIRINLLPVRDILRRKIYLRQIVLSAIGIGCVVFIFIIVGMYQQSLISDRKEEIAKIEAEKQKFNRILAEIKKIEEEKKVLTKRTEVIQQLKQSSSLTVHVLDEIASLTPPNRMWLKSLSQTGNQLSLTGMALDDQTIARFMDDLEASSYIQNVILANSTLEMFAERSLKAFSVTASADMPKTK